MTVERTLDGAVRIICVRGQQLPRCACGAPGVLLCDYATPAEATPGHCVDIDGQWWHEPGQCRDARWDRCCAPGRTCDRALCAGCAVTRRPEFGRPRVDWCPTHPGHP